MTTERADWYKDAILYQVQLRACGHGGGDRRGILCGLASRLDHLRRLGATVVCLSPFYPSPPLDDGWDVTDHTAVDPKLGTLADFRRLLAEAHRRELKVVTELVLDHTSDRHTWFERSRAAPPGSYWRNFYIWSDSRLAASGEPRAGGDLEGANWTYDEIAQAHFWHRSCPHRPDLNYGHRPVRRAMLRVVDFWLSLGVDGIRLDAVAQLSAREGPGRMDLPETHQYLRALRRHVDERFPGRVLLAEAGNCPQDAAAYFGGGRGDECHMVLDLAALPRLLTALRTEDRFPVVDLVRRTPEAPETGQWALSVRNHDQPAPEGPAGKERDDPCRSPAQDPARRAELGAPRGLAAILQHDRQRIELVHSLLLSLPGAPVLCDGEQLGTGDEAELRSVDAAAELEGTAFLLRRLLRLLALRRRHRALGHGRIELVASDNTSVLAFLRHDEREQVLVVANLSRFAQYAELDLSAHRGATLRELLGQSAFPPVGELPYLLTLSPHSCYWFELARASAGGWSAPATLPEVRVPARWWQLLEGRSRRDLEAALPEVLRSRRWYAAKDRRIQSVRVQTRVPLAGEGPRVELLVLEVDYLEGEPERYFLPLAHLTSRDAEEVRRDHPEAVLARTTSPQGRSGLLVDAHHLPGLARTLVGLIRRGRGRGAGPARLVGWATPGSTTLLQELADDPGLRTRVGSAEQSNTSISLGRAGGPRVILKSFRRTEPGRNPEVEIGQHLLGTTAHVARLLGAVELHQPPGAPTALAVLHEFVPNEGDAWTSALRSVGAYLDRLDPAGSRPALPGPPAGGLLEASGAPRLEEPVTSALAEVSSRAELLGRRTGELHVALSRSGEEAFRPEPVTPDSQRELHQSLRTSARRSLALLRRRARHLRPDEQRVAEDVLAGEQVALATARRVLGVRSGARARLHGDLHLGQVLSTGLDYCFIDFEGEPARSLAERRAKRSVLADVAGMLRSYHYAAHTGVAELTGRGVLDPAPGSGASAVPYREAADRWAFWAGAHFLHGYLEAARPSELLPETDVELDAALRAHLLDKAFYELRYELGNRPEWVILPLLGLRSLLAPLGSSPPPAPDLRAGGTEGGHGGRR